MQPGPGSEALSLSLQELFLFSFLFFFTVLLKSNLCQEPAPASVLMALVLYDGEAILLEVC